MTASHSEGAYSVEISIKAEKKKKKMKKGAKGRKKKEVTCANSAEDVLYALFLLGGAK